MARRPLVQRVWHSERERRDDGVETLAPGRDHLVAPLHRADRGFQRTVAGVFEGPARRQHRLFADHARALDALDLTVRVGDDPFPRDELCRLAAAVRDADVVLEQVRSLPDRAALGQEFAADLDADPARGRSRGPGPADGAGSVECLVEIVLLGLTHTTIVIMAWRDN